MQRLEVSGAVRPIYGSLGVKWLSIWIALPSLCNMKARTHIIRRSSAIH